MSSHHHRLSAARAAPSELEAVALLERVLSRGRRAPHVELGIGDDAAVLSFGATRLVWTVDACVEGVHFDRRWLSLEDVGYRSLMAAASDLAAMGAKPVGALAELGLPARFARSSLAAVARGQAAASRAIGCPVIGGNLSRSAELSVVTTVLGSASRPLRRAGARPGDELWLVGDVGKAALGLRLLAAGRRVASALAREAVAAWRRPIARIAHGRALARVAHAGIDVSDGLAGDAGHLARESAVRVVIDERAILGHVGEAFCRAAARAGADPLELALSGGEDYALLATGTRRPPFARTVGRVERGDGVWLARPSGEVTRVTRGGFDHFAGTESPRRRRVTCS